MTFKYQYQHKLFYKIVILAEQSGLESFPTIRRIDLYNKPQCHTIIMFNLKGATMSFDEASLKVHRELSGKISILPKVKINDIKDLATFYTPGIAAVSKKIAEKTCNVWKYTSRSNLVAVISDGSAVLGLGNIGPEAAHPVMAGKAVLFKEFANIDAFPICLDTQDPQKIIETCKILAPSFAGINLEDISAPRCFEIERELQDLKIPVMHDDQHGTAVVVLAGLINATKVTGKNLSKSKIVIVGVGAAGTAIAHMIYTFTKGKAEITAVNSQGIVCDIHDSKNRKICGAVNKNKISGKLEDAILDADIFIGVSAAGVLKKNLVLKMASNPIIFAMANPVPEIMPNEAKEAGAMIVATGRSDFANQVNNVLAFPGIFRGALDAKATKISKEMLLAAAHALANCVKNPTKEKILPNPLDKSVALTIAEAVKKEAIKQKIVRGAC